MTPSKPRVSNLVLRDGAVHSVDGLPPGVTNDELSRWVGHFAFQSTSGDDVLLARDPLGVNKLFYAVGKDGVASSNFFVDLVRAGYEPAQIWSVPSGHAVRINTAKGSLRLEKYSTLQYADDVPAIEAELPDHAGRILQQLEQTFQWLGGALQGRKLYVTLSGGLDSTTIAAMAREHIGDFTAVTFVARDQVRADETGSDLYFARKVAAEFGVPLEIVEGSTQDLLDLLDDTLVYGQDFRDFNVHCGLVNAVLARGIQAMNPHADTRPCVLTGDTMNELVSDYTPVQYGESEYYSLPQLSPGRLRRFLVSGLDTGDREVGVFAQRGIDTIQPYALCANAYTSLPSGFLDNDGAKQQLVRLMLGKRIPSFIYERPKVRAQVADSNQVGGTMAALLDQGIDQPWLAARFAELVGFDPAELKRWIRAGVYRFTSSYPTVPNRL